MKQGTQLDINTAAPPRNPLNPDDNPTGHQWVNGLPGNGGYARCGWCDCDENTKASAAKCPQAYKASCGSGPVEWYRRSKWLPPDGRERSD